MPEEINEIENNQAEEATEVSDHDTSAEETHTEVGEEQEGIAAVAGQFGLDGQIFVAQIINFLIVLVVLWWFAYRPIVKMLDAREEKIKQSVEQADEIEKRVAEIEKERDQIIAEAKSQSQEIIEKAQAQGEKRGEEIIAGAKNEVERVIAGAKAQIADEKAGMMKELRTDIINITIEAAKKVVAAEVDEKKSQQIAEEVIDQMN